MSQFEFLVMIEKNIFAYKLFLSLNISDFNLFFLWKLQPPPPPLFPSNPPPKVEIQSSRSHFLKIWLEVQFPLPLQKGGEGAHYDLCVMHFQIYLQICSPSSFFKIVAIEVRNYRVGKSSYKTKLHKMTSHFELMTRNFL